jgi:hypothetical protein
VIEEVARDHQQIDLVTERSIDDPLEDLSLTLAVRGLLRGIAVAIAVEMDVSGVKDSQRSFHVFAGGTYS